jgi:hypothetical protein
MSERITALWRECGGGTDAYDAERNMALLYAEGLLHQRRTFRQVVEGALALTHLPVESTEEVARAISAGLSASGYGIHDRAQCVRPAPLDVEQRWTQAAALEFGGEELASRVALDEIVDALNTGALAPPSDTPARPERATAGSGPEQDGASGAPGHSAPASVPEAGSSPLPASGPRPRPRSRRAVPA